MAIEPLRLFAAALAVSIACGCSPLVDRCQAGTLVVAVSLDGTAAVADELLIDLSLDGGSAQESSLSHAPGAAVGNVVVQFPRGYPTGSVASVLVTARAGGVVVGRGRAAATLSGSCQATALAVAGGSDDAGSGDDLAVTADLATPPDLRPPPPDLRPPPPDLYCPGGGVELCFNGIDDDCDGLADCADPDCAPVATCVTAAPSPFGYGAQEPAAGTCTAPQTATKMYQADANGGGCASTCSCGASGCTVPLSQSLPVCGDPPTQPPYKTLNHSCTDLEFDNNFLIGAPAGTLACSSSGSAMPVTPPVLTTAVECAMPGTVGQGGCNAGQVCVARGTKQCVHAPGNGVACPSGYPNGVTWFSSYTDGRSCSCSCTNNGCSAAQVAFYGSPTCGGGSPTIKSGYICSPPSGGARLIGFCPLIVTLSGALTFNNANATTVCCP